MPDWAPWWLAVATFETELQVGREGGGVWCFGVDVAVAGMLADVSERCLVQAGLSRKRLSWPRLSDGTRTAPRGWRRACCPSPSPSGLCHHGLSSALERLLFSTSGPLETLFLLPGRLCLPRSFRRHSAQRPLLCRSLLSVPFRTCHLLRWFACSPSSPLCRRLVEDRHPLCCLHCCVPSSAHSRYSRRTRERKKQIKEYPGKKGSS